MRKIFYIVLILLPILGNAQDSIQVDYLSLKGKKMTLKLDGIDALEERLNMKEIEPNYGHTISRYGIKPERLIAIKNITTGDTIEFVPKEATIKRKMVVLGQNDNQPFIAEWHTEWYEFKETQNPEKE